MRENKTNKIYRSGIYLGQMVYGVTNESVVIDGIELLKLEVKPEVETKITAKFERFVVKSEYKVLGKDAEIILRKK